MHPFLADAELERLIREDVPYFDLTTLALGIDDQPGRISFSTRHPTVICGTEEVGRILELCGATVRTSTGSGKLLAPGTVLLEADGPAQALHRAWKVGVNLLEYLSGIATRTHAMVTAARQVNPTVAVVTTRKLFPGTKPLTIKAILAGGATPHRLGLSETVLVFPQHLAFLDGLAGLIDRLDTVKRTCPEKKICVEVEHLEDAVRVARAGADIIQIDKMPPQQLTETVQAVRAVQPGIQIAAAGGINQDNIQAYAATGIDIIVTTAVYFGKPADIGARMVRIEKR